MLPPFIIDQIRRREEEERRRRSEYDRPRLELPIDVHPRPAPEDKVDDEQAERGVIIIDLT
jgi:hypothetical protein